MFHKVRHIVICRVLQLIANIFVSNFILLHFVFCPRIFCEETTESQEDQKVVREISNEFPHLFKM